MDKKQGVFLRLVSPCIYIQFEGFGHSDILLYVTAGWVVLAPRFCIPRPIDETGFSKNKET